MPIKVLIVDDNSLYAEAASAVVQELGYDFLVCEDGLQAKKVLDQDSQYNLIITDIVMPELDGIELSKYIRECLEKKYIIAMSSGASSITRKSALSCALLYCDDTMDKPFLKEDLAYKIEVAKNIINKWE
ncbi:MAG: response regulator [Bdellovibrionales bacterium]